jgi:hypothetical protein
VRAAEEWGMPAWVGAMIRLNDKVCRLQKCAQVGSLANESAEDSMRDIAVYALIALILYRESAGAPQLSPVPDAASVANSGLPDFTSSVGWPSAVRVNTTIQPSAQIAGTVGPIGEY